MCVYSLCCFILLCCVFFFKQKTAYEMRISDWSSDVLLFRSPCRMKIRLILKEILPFYFRLVVLAAVTLFIDLILHLTDLVWIGRYLGIPGVILILLSFGHSLRKRDVIKSSNPVRLQIGRAPV